MDKTEKEYLSMGRKTRLTLALSLDVHRSNASAYFMKYMLDAMQHGDSDKQKLNDQIANTQFDINKDTNPFYRKYINDRLRNEKWIAEQIEHLAYIMLWDILSPTQPTINDLSDKEDLPDAYVIEQKEAQRLINKYYVHMHTHPVKWSERLEKLDDDPNNRVFAWPPRMRRPLPSEDKRLKTVGTPLTLNEKWDREIHLEDFADPYYLERLFRFRINVERMLDTIKRKNLKREKGIRSPYRWVISELLHNDYALTVMFQNASHEVEKRWFEKNITPETKFRTIYRYSRGFSENEIVKAISAYVALYKEIIRKEHHPYNISIEKVKTNALEQITLAALDYANRGSTDIPQWLFSNCLEVGFEIDCKEKALMEHNLGIFKMLNKENGSAALHFKSALEVWADTSYSLLGEIDTWNLCLALERIGKEAISGKSKSNLFNLLATKQEKGLRLFLIRQFADVSDMFGDLAASKRWLARGITESLDQDLELALFFEERLGSRGIIGTAKEERKKAEMLQAQREKYCTILGDTGNFIVTIDKKFYLLKEDIERSAVAITK